MTTDADKIDNLLAQRRELMDKIEEQIYERGRIIERIQSAPAEMMDLPALRVYWAKHRSLGRPTPDVDWEDLDVLIAALDALEEGIESARRHMYALNKAVADERDKTRSLQARIDAATVLIWGAQMDEHMNHGASLKRAALRACEHSNCAPYRAWLAGDKEEHGEA